MFNEFEKEDDSWRPDPPKWTVIVKKAVGYAFSALVIGIIAFLVIRMIMSKPPKDMKELVWNDTLISAYTVAANEGRELEIKQISSTNSFSEDSMFSVYTILYVPEIKQLQFTIRYNNRALNYLVEDYPEAQAIVDKNSDKDPQNDEEIYVFNLTYRKDGQIHTMTDYTSYADSKAGYTYRRLVFENVDLTGIAEIYVNVCYTARPNSPRHTMYVYHDKFAMLDYVYEAPKQD